MFAQNSIVNVMAISHHEQNMNGQKEAFQRKRPFRPICALITSGTWQDDAEVSREPRTENKESKKIGPGWKWLVLVVESMVLTFVLLPVYSKYFKCQQETNDLFGKEKLEKK